MAEQFVIRVLCFNDVLGNELTRKGSMVTTSFFSTEKVGLTFLRIEIFSFAFFIFLNFL